MRIQYYFDKFSLNILYFSIAAGVVILSGCGTVERKVTFDKNYSVSAGTRVELGAVKNKTGIEFDVDVEKMLHDALTESLKAKDLYSTGGIDPKLVLSANIVGYAKGNAFERWASVSFSTVGRGSTALEIEATLYDAQNRQVGTATARRTVDFGGGFTIGAWKRIYTNVADDVVDKLAEQLK